MQQQTSFSYSNFSIKLWKLSIVYLGIDDIIGQFAIAIKYTTLSLMWHDQVVALLKQGVLQLPSMIYMSLPVSKTCTFCFLWQFMSAALHWSLRAERRTLSRSLCSAAQRSAPSSIGCSWGCAVDCFNRYAGIGFAWVKPVQMALLFSRQHGLFLHLITRRKAVGATYLMCIEIELWLYMYNNNDKAQHTLFNWVKYHDTAACDT